MTNERDALPDAATVQRGLHRSERWRDKFPGGSRRRKLYDALFMPIEPPSRFTGPHEELVRQLMPLDADGEPDEERSREVLDEANAIYAEAEARAQSAERRATTLLGAVAIATSLLLSGAALLADPSKIAGGGWRAALAIALAVVVFCLVMAGARALATTSRIHVIHAPTPTNILARSELPLAEARIDLAAETLKDYGYNTKVAGWKVAHLRAAAQWFGRALIALFVLGLLTAAYVICSPEQPASDVRPVTHAPQNLVLTP